MIPMTSADAPAEPPRSSTSLVARTGARFGVDPSRLLTTLAATAFKQTNGHAPTNEQMMALLVVADQYDLNPFTKEIYAYPDKGGIVPVIGVDGWLRIINKHPLHNGMTVSYEGSGADLACTVTIYRKDREHPTTVTEFLVECRRGTQPWQQMPRRMLRHKAIMQCARVAFGFAGIYDEDDAGRILEAGAADGGGSLRTEAEAVSSAAADRLRASVVGSRQKAKAKAGAPQADVIDPETGEMTRAAVTPSSGTAERVDGESGGDSVTPDAPPAEASADGGQMELGQR